MLCIEYRVTYHFMPIIKLTTAPLMCSILVPTIDTVSSSVQINKQNAFVTSTFFHAKSLLLSSPSAPPFCPRGQTAKYLVVKVCILINKCFSRVFYIKTSRVTWVFFVNFPPRIFDRIKRRMNYSKWGKLQISLPKYAIIITVVACFPRIQFIACVFNGACSHLIVN